jgi:hypothetical protein
MPKPAPITHAVGTSTASDGANATAAMPTAVIPSPSATGRRLPHLDAIQPATPRKTVAVSETAKIAIPSSPLSRCSRSLKSGSRAAQVPSTVPNAMNATARAAAGFSAGP